MNDLELVAIWERLTLAAASVAEAIQASRGGGSIAEIVKDAAERSGKASIELKQLHASFRPARW
jgi:hypothetical protein